jgi:hypothetical protein
MEPRQCRPGNINNGSTKMGLNHFANGKGLADAVVNHMKALGPFASARKQQKLFLEKCSTEK